MDSHHGCRFSVNDRGVAVYVQWLRSKDRHAVSSYERFSIPGHQSNLVTLFLKRVQGTNMTTRARYIFFFCAGIILGCWASQSLPIPHAHATEQGTRIAIDGDVISFIINNREQARLDTNGLHIKGGVNYSGIMMDTVRYLPDEGKKP